MFPTVGTGVGRVLVGVAAEEEGSAGPAAKQAAGYADHPASAVGLLTHICGDLKQDQVNIISLQVDLTQTDTDLT